MAETATAGKKKARQTKLRVIDSGAPRALRDQSRIIVVTAIEKGWYNNRRRKRGDTFKMRVIGDESLPLPSWLAYADDPEARAVVEMVIAEQQPKNLPAGVSMSRASFPEAVEARDLTEVRNAVARRIATGEHLPQLSIDDEDGEEQEDLDSDESTGSTSSGGGGGRADDEVI